MAAPVPPKTENKNPWDVHFYWTAEENDDALQIREKMNEAFPQLRYFDPHKKPIGPHPVPMWEADFANFKDLPVETITAERDKIIEWLKGNRGNHSVLIHPHTDAGALADHTTGAIWLGDKLPLKLETLQ